MDHTDSIVIDLEQYGGKGEIVMAAPSLRRMSWLKNQVGKHAKFSPHGGMTDADVGDIEILNVLVYVRTAPFPVDLNAFYSFCDSLDDAKPGNSVELFNKMTEAMKSITEGATSPLAQ